MSKHIIVTNEGAEVEVITNEWMPEHMVVIKAHNGLFAFNLKTGKSRFFDNVELHNMYQEVIQKTTGLVYPKVRYGP